MEQNVKLTKLASCAGCGPKWALACWLSSLTGLLRRATLISLWGLTMPMMRRSISLPTSLPSCRRWTSFPPMVDDPYVFGQVAAANALSDLYAMGARPITALNVMAVPEDMPAETVRAILRGGLDKVTEAGSLACGRPFYLRRRTQIWYGGDRRHQS